MVDETSEHVDAEAPRAFQGAVHVDDVEFPMESVGQTGQAPGTSVRPFTLAFNSPMAEGHRERKWTLYAGSVLSTGGGSLAQQAIRAANASELLRILPQLSACCYEMRKEEALSVAARVASVEASESDRTLLRHAALTLLESAVARARDAHGPEFLVEVLEIMMKASVGTRHLVDQLLAALHTQLIRVPLSPALAERIAMALSWVGSALRDEDDCVPLFSTASRRVVAGVKEVLARQGSCTGHMASMLELLSDGATPGRSILLHDVV